MGAGYAKSPAQSYGMGELGQIALKLKPGIEQRAAEKPGALTDLSAILPEGPVDPTGGTGQTVGIGERTMGKIMKIDEQGTDAVKRSAEPGQGIRE